MCPSPPRSCFEWARLVSEVVGGWVESGPEISPRYARRRGEVAFDRELEIRFYLLCVRCKYKNRRILGWGYRGLVCCIVVKYTTSGLDPS
jgi:hypothetical protein